MINPPKFIASLPSHSNQSEHWVKQVNSAINADGIQHDENDYCQIQCRMIQNKLTLIYPNELTQQSPDLLEYLGQFTKKNGMKLLQERRIKEVDEYLEEFRKPSPPVIALGVGLLLQKTGLTGEDNLHLPSDSVPQIIDGRQFKQLINLASQVEKTGKSVTIPANRFLQDSNMPKSLINGYAGKINRGDESRTFSLFHSPLFRAIGYTQRSDFVFHVFAGGGSIDNPQVWGPLSNMTREPIHIRLFRDQNRDRKFAVLYTTYNLDLKHSAKKLANWKSHSIAS